jgi:hypothetical protein
MKRHPSPAVLRRMQDEPAAAGEQDRLHVESCPVCRQRQEVMAANASVAAAALATAVPGTVDPLPALRRLRSNETAFLPPRPGGVDRLRSRLALARRRTLRVGAVATVVVVTMGTLVATGAAGSLIKVFQPDSFVPVSINLTSFTTLPDLSGFGTTHIIQVPSVTMTATQAAAASASGLHLLTPGSFPSSIKGNATYLVATQGSGSFTFSASAASGTAGRLGRPLPTMPADLNGSSLTLTGGPVVAELVGSQNGTGILGSLLGGPAGSGTAGIHGRISSSKAAPGSKHSLGTGSGTPGPSGHGLLGGLTSIPQLAIVQMKAPTLYSNGPSVTQYENALLSMPGVPASVAAQIRSLGNLSSTLPIPIPTSLAASSTADINGAPGLVIGDTTGIASAVFWQSHGLLYAVVGSLTDHQVVAIARSMH